MRQNQFNKIKNENDFEYKTVGFPNIGNSCYMNSFLQILLHCPNFLKELKKGGIILAKIIGQIIV